MIIERDGKFYKQTIIEEEIHPEQEEYKLQAWKDALINDARELEEYQSKIAEIDALKISDAHKNTLKSQVVLHSPSGIKLSMVDEQELTVEAINLL